MSNQNSLSEINMVQEPQHEHLSLQQIQNLTPEELRPLLRQYGITSPILPTTRSVINGNLYRRMTGQYPVRPIDGTGRRVTFLTSRDVHNLPESKVRSLLIQYGFHDLPDKLGPAWKDELFRKISNSDHCKNVGCNEITTKGNVQSIKENCEKNFCCYYDEFHSDSSKCRVKNMHVSARTGGKKKKSRRNRKTRRRVLNKRNSKKKKKTNRKRKGKSAKVN